MLNLKYKRQGEGVYIRVFFLLYLLLLSIRFATSVYTVSISTEWGNNSLLGIKSLGEFGFTWGKVIAVLSFALFAFSSYLFLNSSKVANFLIETQNELAVVAKPSKKEYLGASVAVLIMVVIMSMYLAIIDSFFTIIFFK